MLRHVNEGMPAAQAAELAIGARFRVAPRATATATETAQRVTQSRTAMQGALESYDESKAEQALEKLLATSTATTVIRDVLLPHVHDTGQRWVDGSLSIAQEHFASTFIHSRLLGLARGWDHGLGPRALLACPPNEQHTFGLIAFGIALHQLGWRITYLGPDTPIPMIAEAADSMKPRLVVTAVAIPDRLNPVLPELQDLSARWPLAIGGGGANRQLAKHCGALHLPDDPITAANSIFS